MEEFIVFDWTTLSGIGAGTIAFVLGLYQYIGSQHWKRIEFIASQVKDFKSQRAVRNVIKMLDYNCRSIELFPERANPKERFVEVTDDKIISALVVHKENKEHNASTFNQEELAIRDCFDLYLEGFERFEHFLQSGLVNKEDLEPYLLYDLQIMANTHRRKPDEFKEALRNFIEAYNYTGIFKLGKRYGLCI